MPQRVLSQGAEVVTFSTDGRVGVLATVTGAVLYWPDPVDYSVQEQMSMPAGLFPLVLAAMDTEDTYDEDSAALVGKVSY